MKRLLTLLVAVLIPFALQAQTYPSKPVRIVVPFPAGGPADIFGRGLAQGMSAELGQPVLVENIGGVGGVLGVDRVAKATPDGYMLALNSASTVSIAPYSLAKMPYDVKKDLALITVVVRVPEVLAVHPSVPAKNVAELIAYAKANPGKINFGSAGGGSITHLAGELLKAEAKVNMVHVAYKGAAPAVTDLVGGQVQMGIFDVPVLLGHIRAGRLKALAVTSASRASTLPDVLKRIHAAAVAVLKSPAIQEQYGKVSGVPSPGTPEDYARFLAAEQAKWSKVVSAIGFKN